MCDLALGANCFSLSEYDFINKLIGYETQKETALKFIIRKGKEECYKFIKQLYFHSYSSIIAVLSKQDDETVPELGENRDLKVQFLRSEEDFLRQNLKVKDLLDMLFEREVLTVDDHDQIQRHTSRAQKRETLLTILFNKPNDEWLSRFLGCLQITGHEGMLEELRIRTRIRTTGPDTWGDEYSQYVAHISSTETTNQDFAEENRQLIDEFVDSGVLDLWIGSLYLLLCTSHPDKIDSIIEKRDANKLKELLHGVFNKNPKLVDKFGLDKILKFELEKRSHDFLNKEHGKKPCVDRKVLTEDCLYCFLETVHGNYSKICDEIEDDIISDVISNCPTFSEYSKKLCLDPKKTRVQTANALMQLALANDFILEALRDSLKRLSSATFTPFKCLRCNKGSECEGPSFENEKAVFYFRLHRSEDGIIEVKMENQIGAPLKTNSITRKLSRSKSFSNTCPYVTPASGASNGKRVVVVIGESDRVNPELRRIENLYNRKFNAYTLPISSRNDFEVGEKIKCATYVSPGPHAFLILCEINKVESRIQPLVSCFGETVMNHIFLILIINEDSPTEQAETTLENLVNRGVFIVIHKDELLDSLKTKLADVSDYFTNSCFEKLEKHIMEEKKTRDKINQLKIENLKHKIQCLEQHNSRLEAVKFVADRLVCGNVKPPKKEDGTAC